MVYSFKRSRLSPVFRLICGLFMLVAALWLLAISPLAGLIDLVLAILFLSQAGWGFVTPIVIINNGMFYHKKGLFSNEDFELKHVEKVELADNSRVVLIFFNGHQEKIQLFNMRSSDYAEFRKVIVELVEARSL
jgi:hypothetical protein